MSIWTWGMLVMTTVATTGGLVLGCGGDGAPWGTDHEGYPAYRKYCRRCHGNRGEASRASRMAKRPVTLVAPAFRDTVDVETIRTVIRDGKGRMEGYATKLSPAEIDALTRYVLDLPAPDGEP